MTAVVDASVLVKWFVEEEGADDARVLQDHALIAPDLLIVETTNVLWKKVRSDAFEPRDVALALKVIGRANIAIEPTLPLAARAFDIGRALNHAVYDCFYLALAERRALPLISADDRLARKLAAAPTASHASVFALKDFVATLRM